jgi:hypothetical protein
VCVWGGASRELALREFDDFARTAGFMEVGEEAPRPLLEAVSGWRRQLKPFECGEGGGHEIVRAQQNFLHASANARGTHRRPFTHT